MRALSLEATYVREGARQGNLFVARNGADLELTTPAYVIRITDRSALELFMELQRLYGWSETRRPPGAAAAAPGPK